MTNCIQNDIRRLNLPLSGTCRKWVLGLLGGLAGGLFACNKVVEIEAPPASIPQAQVFSTDQEALSALSGAYYHLANSHEPTVINGGMTIFPALSADELLVFDQGNTVYMQFNQNKILADNMVIAGQLWSAAYKSIYQFNAILEGVQASVTLDPNIAEQLKGHAYFGRALLHYELAQLFGSIPLITTTNWRQTSIQSQVRFQEICKQVVNDLLQAIELLPIDYDLLKGGRIIANKYAAMALLARVYAHMERWQDVAGLCDQIINSGIYELVSTPAAVFSANSKEAILQWQQDVTGWSFNATREGMTLMPINGIFPFPPFAYLTQSLVAAFEQNDARKTQWIQQRNINNQLYQYPAKYKVGPSEAMPGEAPTESYVVMRLAEIILLRAEAGIHLLAVPGAMAGINMIRARADLEPLPINVTPARATIALQQERRVELFCEWGHRWNDLKRWGIALDTLERVKGVALSIDQLVYPIPAGELLSNPSLQQNAGY